MSIPRRVGRPAAVTRTRPNFAGQPGNPDGVIGLAAAAASQLPLFYQRQGLDDDTASAETVRHLADFAGSLSAFAVVSAAAAADGTSAADCHRALADVIGFVAPTVDDDGDSIAMIRSYGSGGGGGGGESEEERTPPQKRPSIRSGLEENHVRGLGQQLPIKELSRVGLLHALLSESMARCDGPACRDSSCTGSAPTGSGSSGGSSAPTSPVHPNPPAGALIQGPAVLCFCQDQNGSLLCPDDDKRLHMHSRCRRRFCLLDHGGERPVVHQLGPNTFPAAPSASLRGGRAVLCFNANDLRDVVLPLPLPRLSACACSSVRATPVAWGGPARLVRDLVHGDWQAAEVSHVACRGCGAESPTVKRLSSPASLATRVSSDLIPLSSERMSTLIMRDTFEGFVEGSQRLGRPYPPTALARLLEARSPRSGPLPLGYLRPLLLVMRAWTTGPLAVIKGDGMFCCLLCGPQPHKLGQDSIMKMKNNETEGGFTSLFAIPGPIVNFNHVTNQQLTDSTYASIERVEGRNALRLPTSCAGGAGGGSRGGGAGTGPATAGGTGAWLAAADGPGRKRQAIRVQGANVAVCSHLRPHRSMLHASHENHAQHVLAVTVDSTLGARHQQLDCWCQMRRFLDARLRADVGFFDDTCRLLWGNGVLVRPRVPAGEHPSVIHLVTTVTGVPEATDSLPPPTTTTTPADTGMGSSSSPSSSSSSSSSSTTATSASSTTSPSSASPSPSTIAPVVGNEGDDESIQDSPIASLLDSQLMDVDDDDGGPRGRGGTPPLLCGGGGGFGGIGGDESERGNGSDGEGSVGSDGEDSSSDDQGFHRKRRRGAARSARVLAATRAVRAKAKAAREARERGGLVTSRATAASAASAAAARGARAPAASAVRAATGAARGTTAAAAAASRRTLGGSLAIETSSSSSSTSSSGSSSDASLSPSSSTPSSSPGRPSAGAVPSPLPLPRTRSLLSAAAAVGRVVIPTILEVISSDSDTPSSSSSSSQSSAPPTSSSSPASSNRPPSRLVSSVQAASTSASAATPVLSAAGVAAAAAAASRAAAVAAEDARLLGTFNLLVEHLSAMTRDPEGLRRLRNSKVPAGSVRVLGGIQSMHVFPHKDGCKYMHAARLIEKHGKPDEYNEQFFAQLREFVRAFSTLGEGSYNLLWQHVLANFCIQANESVAEQACTDVLNLLQDVEVKAATLLRAQEDYEAVMLQLPHPSPVVPAVATAVGASSRSAARGCDGRGSSSTPPPATAPFDPFDSLHLQQAVDARTNTAVAAASAPRATIAQSRQHFREIATLLARCDALAKCLELADKLRRQAQKEAAFGQALRTSLDAEALLSGGKRDLTTARGVLVTKRQQLRDMEAAFPNHLPKHINFNALVELDMGAALAATSAIRVLNARLNVARGRGLDVGYLRQEIRRQYTSALLPALDSLRLLAPASNIEEVRQWGKSVPTAKAAVVVGGLPSSLGPLHFHDVTVAYDTLLDAWLDWSRTGEQLLLNVRGVATATLTVASIISHLRGQLALLTRAVPDLREALAPSGLLRQSVTPDGGAASTAADGLAVGEQLFILPLDEMTPQQTLDVAAGAAMRTASSIAHYTSMHEQLLRTRDAVDLLQPRVDAAVLFLGRGAAPAPTLSADSKRRTNLHRYAARMRAGNLSAAEFVATAAVALPKRGRGAQRAAPTAAAGANTPSSGGGGGGGAGGTGSDSPLTLPGNNNDDSGAATAMHIEVGPAAAAGAAGGAESDADTDDGSSTSDSGEGGVDDSGDDCGDTD